jgi:N-acetylmuramoyl-L-alanine amidase
MKKICIDPGHPSYFRETKKINWGCEGNGIREVELNLKLAILLGIELQNYDFDVLLTRENNTTIVSNKERVLLAKEFNADLFLRIHLDSDKEENESIRGTKTIYPPINAKNISDKSQEIATAIHEDIVLKTDLIDRGVCDERICNLKNRDGMLEGTYWADKFNIPSVLLEVVYLSNKEDARWISREENQMIYIRAVAEGLVKYVKK